MIKYDFNKASDTENAMKNLYDIAFFLRDPKDGCPWDLKQKPKDIIRCLQGEVYEYIDALSENDNEHIKEELGDVFFSLILLAVIHEQDGSFSFVDCINSACEKYIRRHPHVFSDNIRISDSEKVLENWEKIKRDVEGRKESFFSRKSKNLPEMERCYEISKEAANIGFEWKTFKNVADKVREEIKEAEAEQDNENLESELGDVLFSAINLCRFCHIKPQNALQHANNKFIKRFEYLIELAKEENVELKNLSAHKWENLWQKAKKVFPN